jgi:phage baseplate assembly protein W
MTIDYPYDTDGRGRTASTDLDDHVRDLVEQVLLTAPGERVMRPDFGSGVMALTFEPNSNELAATTQYLVQGALDQWLGNVINVTDVTVEAIEATLAVTVSYLILATQTPVVSRIEAP